MHVSISTFPDGKQNATREAGGVSTASNPGSAAMVMNRADGAKAKCAVVAPGRVGLVTLTAANSEALAADCATLARVGGFVQIGAAYQCGELWFARMGKAGS